MNVKMLLQGKKKTTCKNTSLDIMHGIYNLEPVPHWHDDTPQGALEFDDPV